MYKIGSYLFNINSIFYVKHVENETKIDFANNMTTKDTYIEISSGSQVVRFYSEPFYGNTEDYQMALKLYRWFEKRTNNEIINAS